MGNIVDGYYRRIYDTFVMIQVWGFLSNLIITHRNIAFLITLTLNHQCIIQDNSNYLWAK